MLSSEYKLHLFHYWMSLKYICLELNIHLTLFSHIFFLASVLLSFTNMKHLNATYYVNKAAKHIKTTKMFLRLNLVLILQHLGPLWQNKNKNIKSTDTIRINGCGSETEKLYAVPDIRRVRLSQCNIVKHKELISLWWNWSFNIIQFHPFTERLQCWWPFTRTVGSTSVCVTGRWEKHPLPSSAVAYGSSSLPHDSFVLKLFCGQLQHYYKCWNY